MYVSPRSATISWHESRLPSLSSIDTTNGSRRLLSTNSLYNDCTYSLGFPRLCWVSICVLTLTNSVWPSAGHIALAFLANSIEYTAGPGSINVKNFDTCWHQRTVLDNWNIKLLMFQYVVRISHISPTSLPPIRPKPYHRTHNSCLKYNFQNLPKRPWAVGLAKTSRRDPKLSHITWLYVLD